MTWTAIKSLTECPQFDKCPKWLLPCGWPSQTEKAKAQHNIWHKPPAVCLSLPHWASILFCGFPTHLLWEDGVNKPHLLEYFSHLAFPFHPCSQTTHTHLITFLFSYCNPSHRTAFSHCWTVRMLLPKLSFLFWLWHLPLQILACFLSRL